MRWLSNSIQAYVVQKLHVHARRPGGGFWGFVFRQALKSNNVVEEIMYDKMKMEPHHNVLELGFGYGHGLGHALGSGLREGSGTLYGIDHSSKVCDHVGKIFAQDIGAGNLVIYNENVLKLPLPEDHIDRVCHANCFFYWPDHLAVCKELLRVMKPGGLMVTGIQYDRVKHGVSIGLVPKAESDLDFYLKCLTEAGFQNVCKEVVEGLSSGVSEVQVIYAGKALE